MTSLPLRPELAGIEPYGAPQLGGLIQLNVNENPFAPPPEVIDDIAESVRAAAAGLNRYPDREFTELREALAGYLADEADAPLLTPAHLWAANGSNEAMVQLCQAFGGPGRTALTCEPTYSMYPEYARDTNTGYVTCPRGADFSIPIDDVLSAIERHRPSLILLASPNNPSGTAVPLAQIEQILAVTSGAGTSGPAASAIVVVDEAYAEFRPPGAPSALSLLPDHPHLVVARTMSKAFALAGARVGYLAANPPVLDAVRTVRLPYHLSAITQQVALAALRHAAALQRQVETLRAERDRMVVFLRSLSLAGVPLDVPESQANFVLFGRLGDRRAVWEGLVARGVLIREVGPPGYLRVSIGTPEENETFRVALTEVLGEASS